MALARILVAFLWMAGGATVVSGQERPPVPPVRGVPTDTVPKTAAPEAAPDSILERLRGLQGYTPTEYQGENAVYRAGERVLRLHGNAQVRREGESLTADTIVFREPQSLVEAYGNPKVSGREASDVEGRVMYYDLDSRRATVKGAKTTFTDGAKWYVYGDVNLEGSERFYASHGRFTSCDLEEPHYHFESDQILMIRNNILVARPARLYFGDVPVLWLPFIVQSLEKGRRSGILTPRFGLQDIVQTSDRQQRSFENLGFYWAINEYMGGSLWADWVSNRYTSLSGELQYKWRQRFLDGRFSYRQNWEEDGSTNTAISTNNRWQPTERTDISLNGNYASSSAFVRRNTVDPTELTQNLTSNFGLNHRFDWGTVTLSAQRNQQIASGDVTSTLPSLMVNPKAITLFPSATPGADRWYNNGTLKYNLSLTRTQNDYESRGIGDRRRDNDQLRGQLGQSLTLGDFSWNTQLDLNRQILSPLGGGLDTTRLSNGVQVDSFPDVLESQLGEGSLSTSANYTIRLIGNTQLTPGISYQRSFRQDSIFSTDAYHIGPGRFSLNTGLRTELFGIFRGVGPYSAIRHHITPSLTYSYTPEARLTELDEKVFGARELREQNRISFSFNQTFEAKLRERRPEADTARAEGAAAPTEARKIQLLSLNFTPLTYDFVQKREDGVGFVTPSVTTNIRSDFLRDIDISFTHDLFDQSAIAPERRKEDLGRFDPYLTSLRTGIRFNQNSAFFRWLGFSGGDAPEEAPVPDETPGGVLPNTPPQRLSTPLSPSQDRIDREGAGGGPWSVSLDYTLYRPRDESLREFDEAGVPLDDRKRRSGFGSEGQNVGANISFAPTPNWTVRWNTTYSLTTGEFDTHRLNLRRNLHRWQANFDFIRAHNGNTAFRMYVELIDNRDLKLEYDERNLGGERPR